MGSHPVRLSRATAEGIADFLHRFNAGMIGHYPPGNPWSVPAAAAAELDAALTDAATAAAWEPLRGDVLALQHRDRELPVRAVAKVDQLVAQMRERFDAAGMSIDDPDVVRTILLTIQSVSGFAASAHAGGSLSYPEWQGVKFCAHPVALAAARLVDPEDLG